jgi:hypothetical protein
MAMIRSSILRLVLAILLPMAQARAAACTVPAIPPIAHSDAPTNKQLVYLLDNTTYPDARCNDGTPAGYIFRPGSGLGTRRWVVNFTHYSFCESNEACAGRDNTLLSTKAFKSGVSAGPAMTAMLSPDPDDNPDFYDANTVLVIYCSSDIFTGDKTPTKTPFDKSDAAETWYFQGRAIAVAVVQDLLARQGMSDATELLFTGDSSGAFGLLLNVNDLLPLLPSGIRTVVAPDGGFLQDFGAYDVNDPDTDYVSPARPTPIETVMATGHDFWGGRGDRLCDAAAHTSLEHTQCYITGLVMQGGYIPPPVLAVNALDDLFQLNTDGMPSKGPAAGSPEAIYSTAFARSMTNLLLGSGASNAAFSPYAFEHQFFTSTTIFQQRFKFLGPMEVSARQALGAWYLDPCQGEKLIGASLQ